MSSTSKLKLVIAVTLAVATAAVYWEVRYHGFVNYDDTVYVTANRHVQAGMEWSTIGWAFKTTFFGNWIPLTWLSHILDYQVYGLNAGGHHMTSLIIHVVNVVLLFLLLERLTRSVWKSAMVAALFALHPLNVESVAWIAERKNILCTVFWIVGIWCYVWYAARPGWKRYVVTVAVFVMGLMSKSMVVTLPFVLLLMDYWPLGRIGGSGGEAGEGGESGSTELGTWGGERRRAILRLLVEKVPFIVLAVGDGIVTIRAQVESRSLGTIEGFPLGVRISNAVVAYVAYIEKMLWPSKLAVFYPHPRSHLPIWKVVVAVAILVCITAAVMWGAKRFRYLAVGWLWFLVTLVPVIGVIQAGAQSMADRYAYIPLMGIFIMVVWGISDLIGHYRRARDYVIVSAVCAVFACIIVTRIQLGYWTNSITLWAHTQEVTEDNFTAYNNLGDALWDQGMRDQAGPWCLKSIEVNPNFAAAQASVGVILVNSGRLDEGIAHLNRAVELDPQLQHAYNWLGEALLSKGQEEEAIRCLEVALRIDPEYAPALGNMGVAYEREGKLAEASGCYEKAIRFAMDREMGVQLRYSYGNVLVKSGEVGKAMEAYRAALRLKPDYSPAAEALNGIVEKSAVRP